MVKGLERKVVLSTHIHKRDVCEERACLPTRIRGEQGGKRLGLITNRLSLLFLNNIQKVYF